MIKSVTNFDEKRERSFLKEVLGKLWLSSVTISKTVEKLNLKFCTVIIIEAVLSFDTAEHQQGFMKYYRRVENDIQVLARIILLPLGYCYTSKM